MKQEQTDQTAPGIAREDWTYTKPLPFWLQSASTRRTACGDWIVTLRARTHDIGHGKSLAIANVRLRRQFDKPEHAVHWAQGTPTAQKLRTTARGCWIMRQLKDRWDAETRRDILGNLAREMRAKYDGISYLYESDEAQSELETKLKLAGMFAMNFPTGLVAKSNH